MSLTAARRPEDLSKGDMFSLGVTLAEVVDVFLVGNPPTEDRVDVSAMIQSAVAHLRRAKSNSLARVIDECCKVRDSSSSPRCCACLRGVHLAVRLCDCVFECECVLEAVRVVLCLILLDRSLQ